MWTIAIRLGVVLAISSSMGVAHAENASPMKPEMHRLVAKTTGQGSLLQNVSIQCAEGEGVCTGSNFVEWCIPLNCQCGQYQGTWVNCRY